MSLDARPSDAELLLRHAEQQARQRVTDRHRPPVATLNGIALGPDSPVRATSRSAKPARKRTIHADPSEHDIQAELFAKVNDPAEQLRRPALALVHAIPNGGQRSPRTAGMLKAEGVKPGVPDIDCPVARGGYHGLRIEMKRPGATTTPAQADWLFVLAREGYKTALHTTAEGAWAELIAYLDSPRTVVA